MCVQGHTRIENPQAGIPAWIPNAPTRGKIVYMQQTDRLTIGVSLP